MNAPSTPRVGVALLPELAQYLTQSGYEVITGSDYRAAAQAIRAALDSGDPFPIITSDVKWAGIRTWVNGVASRCPVVVVRVPHGDPTIQYKDVIEVTAPLSVAEIAAAVGLGVSPHVAGEPVYGYDREQSSPSPAPAVPMPTPVAAVESAFDTVETPFQPQPAAQQAPPALAAEEDPWDEIENTMPSAVSAPSAAVPTPVAEPEFESVAPVHQPVREEAPLTPAFHGTPHVEHTYAEPVTAQEPVPAAQVPPSWDTEDVFAAVPTPTTEQAAAPVATPAHPAAHPAVTVAAPPVTTAFDPTPTPPRGLRIAREAEPAMQAPQPVLQPVGDFATQQSPVPVPAPVPEPAPAYYEPVASPAVDEPFSAPAPRAAEPPVFEAQPPYAAPDPIPSPSPAYEQAQAVEPLAPVSTPTYQPSSTPVYQSPQPAYVAEPAPVPTAYDETPAMAPLAPAPETYPEPVAVTPPATESASAPAPSGATSGQVVVVFAGKGGVGKTSISLGLAHRAALAGLRVVLIDGNFGQGDLRVYLRVAQSHLPSIYDYAVSGDLRRAVITPTALAGARGLDAEPLGFALVTAPPDHLTDPTVVTPRTYLDLVNEARQYADLVVVDTQIIEPKAVPDPMVTGFVDQLIYEGAWSVGITDMSTAGITNLIHRVSRIAATQTIGSQRQMTLVNRAPADARYDATALISALSEHATYLATVLADTTVHSTMSVGRAPGTIPSYAGALDAVLSTVGPDWVPRLTSLSATPQASTAHGEGTGGVKKTRGLFGKRR